MESERLPKCQKSCQIISRSSHVSSRMRLWADVVPQASEGIGEPLRSQKKLIRQLDVKDSPLWKPEVFQQLDCCLGLRWGAMGCHSFLTVCSSR